jgi:hypothetical protein
MYYYRFTYLAIVNGTKTTDVTDIMVSDRKLNQQNVKDRIKAERFQSHPKDRPLEIVFTSKIKQLTEDQYKAITFPKR